MRLADAAERDALAYALVPLVERERGVAFLRLLAATLVLEDTWTWD